jgi:acyl-CoA dehydrogenase
MPDLILDEDRKQYQDLASDFAKKELAPRAHEFDTSGASAMDIWRKAWDIGLMNVRFPESLGGLALSVGDACVIIEELAAGCAGISAAIWGHDLATAPPLVAASPEQKAKWLDPLAAEFGLAGYVFEQAGTGSGLRYRKDGSGFKINGNAVAINAKNGVWVTAIADGENGERTVFVVPKEGIGEPRQDMPGLHLAPVGLKAADISEIRIENYAVSAEHVIGTVGGGDAVMNEARKASYPMFASVAVGIIRSALEHATRYAKERQTMGKPIGQHQAVAFMLADIAKDAEAARFLVRKAAWFADNGGADLSGALICKTFAIDAAMKATTDAVQVYGGYGYSREYPVEKLMRDAKTIQVLEYRATKDRMWITKERALNENQTSTAAVTARA